MADNAPVVLDVEHPRRPGLRVEVAGHGRLVLRQEGTVILMALVERDHCGVEYASTGAFRSPVPPIRASHAASPGGRHSRWAHHMAAALTTSTAGPLHTGRWVLGDATHLRHAKVATIPPPDWSELLLPANRGYIDWFVNNGAWQVIPLRPLADPDAGRVKAYRKQAREGVLAPILLWWISGLDCYVILDGHDRLVAALAENLKPPILALSSVSAEQSARDTEAALSRYATTAEALDRQIAVGAPGAAEALVAVNQQLATNLKTIDCAYGVTRAWPLRGGSPQWNVLAAATFPDLPFG